MLSPLPAGYEELATPIGRMASADVKELQRIAKKLCAKETCAIQFCLQGIYNNYEDLDKLRLNVAVLYVHDVCCTYTRFCL